MNKLLTQSFSTFLRRRRARQHFERRPLLGSLVAAPQVGAASSSNNGIDAVGLGRDLLPAA